MSIQEIKDQIIRYLEFGLKNPLAPITEASDEEKEQAVHELELESRIIVVREQDHPILKGKIKRIFLADSL